jgi:pyrimidine-specific ribonucleoside hydrolase
MRPHGLVVVLVAVVLGCQQAAAPAPVPEPSASTGGAPSPGPLPTAPPVRLLVDTDGAPDDLVAISFLVAAPTVEIAAISVSGTGEVHCPRGADLILRLLERLEAPAIPVACGGDRPIALDHAFPDVFRSNADAAAGLDLPTTTRPPAESDAVGLIAATVQASGPPISILTLGPLTNLAQALQGEDLADRIEAVYVMGGAVDVPGNVGGSPGGPQDNTSAEWNAYVDPVALAAVLDADLTVNLVSLDGTNQVPLTRAFAERVTGGATGTPLRVLAELLAKNDYMRSGSFYLWDAVAAVAAAGFPVVEFTDARITVDVDEGPTSGATRRVEGAPNAAYMTGADAATIETLLISVMNGGR